MLGHMWEVYPPCNLQESAVVGIGEGESPSLKETMNMEGFFKDVIGVRFRMNYLRKIITGVLLSSTVIAHAGFYGNTCHSRGNCFGFNESITWNWNEYHWWEVKSIHFRQKGNGPDTHTKMAFMAYTWRAAAYDFFNDPSGGNADQYWVQGYHYYMAYDGTKVYDSYTQSGDCGGYNGWWDFPHARGE